MITDQNGATSRTTVSFEFFPPKTPEGLESLMNTVSEIEELEPSFVSVTCRAGEPENKKTRDLVAKIRESSTLNAVPHLTCRERSRDEVWGVLEQYAADGVQGILALAGDPIGPDETPGDFKYASDLVELIQKFNDRLTDPTKRFKVGVAGFPEGHPDTPNRIQEMEHLKAKVDAGADWICTQLFFDNRDYYDYRERCQLEGIEIPVLAGIMPVTSWKLYEKVAELAGGARYPAALMRSFRRCETEDAVSDVGIHWATEQCRDLLDHEVDGLHFYTLNRSRATLDIYKSLGVRSSSALAVA